jgi:hypothetical protein
MTMRRSVSLAAAALLLWLAGRSPAQSLNQGAIQPDQVNRAVDLESVKVDLAFCASELDELQGAPSEQALQESVDNPDCRRAILKAQAAGMTKSQIVTILMGGADVPDSQPNQPPVGAGGGSPPGGASPPAAQPGS